jgi:hypothetical protein
MQCQVGRDQHLRSVTHLFCSEAFVIHILPPVNRVFGAADIV